MEIYNDSNKPASSTMSSSVSSSLLTDGDYISPDCRCHIFQYLSLYDCLKFTSTSHKSLEVILPELQRRRHIQFLCRHETLELKGGKTMEYPILRPVYHQDGVKGDAETDDENQFLYPFESIDTTEDIWLILPSVKERLEALYRILPISHPSNEDLRQLVLDLQEQNWAVVSSNDNSSSIEQLFSITKAHRLHCSLISSCTIQLNPVVSTQSTYTTTTGNNENNENLTVTLGQYMGDVLSSYCLMSHSYDLAGIVEGGPSFDDWISYMSATDDTSGPRIKARRRYQIFVYLHSGLLRNIPLTKEQAQESGISSMLSGITCPWKNNEHPCRKIINNRCFVSPLEPYFSFTKMHSFKGMLKLTLNDFGPLGPAFRGRDRVSSRTVTNKKFCHVLYSYSEGCFFADKLEADITNECRENLPKVIDWMIIMHRESAKHRPMTVLPPLVTVSETREIENDDAEG